MKLKHAVAISLFIFFVVVIGVVVGGFLAGKSANVSGPLSGGSREGSSSGKTVTLTAEEVAKHASVNDCWTIIGGKVYDITNEISSHPGGESTITPFCGTDGTEGFQTKDRLPGRDHSSSAYSMLNDYLLGNLNDTINL